MPSFWLGEWNENGDALCPAVSCCCQERDGLLSQGIGALRQKARDKGDVSMKGGSGQFVRLDCHVGFMKRRVLRVF